MSRLLTLWRREVESFFYSPMAYFVMGYFLLIMGASFGWVLDMLARGAAGTDVIQRLFGSGFFWLAVLVVVPVITMRLFAEEHRQGTIETLLTAPITPSQLVMAKFLGAFTFYVFLWLPTLSYVYLIQYFAGGQMRVDMGAVGGAYLGTALIGAAYIGIGVFFSSFSVNQIVAAISTYAALLLLFFIGFLPWIVGSDILEAIFRYMSGIIHMDEFARGVISSQPVVFYLSVLALSLYATYRLLENRDWR